MGKYYLDLFAGAGGLSEGFIRAGFEPVAHVEMDKAACYTLKTRQAYNWLLKNNKMPVYEDYISGKINRENFYSNVPDDVLNSVLNYEISPDTLDIIFSETDILLQGRKLDVIVGGPPCQAYSLVGRSRDKNKMLGDKRNYLYQLYAEFLTRYKPEYFVFENVTGLLSAKDTDEQLHFSKMKDLFNKCGYSVEYKILSAYDYGVLQNRKRIILVGRYGEHEDFYPSIPACHTSALVGEIFADLPELKSGEGVCTAIRTMDYHGEYLYKSRIKSSPNELVTFHRARHNKENDLEIYRIAAELWNENHKRLVYTDLPEELRKHKNLASFLDRYKVIEADMPFAHTVVAHISKDGHYYIHPDVMQNRSLTPREAARLQSFPDNYYFESMSGVPSSTAAYKQIGNAVPVLMAEHIATAIASKIEE